MVITYPCKVIEHHPSEHLVYLASRKMQHTASPEDILAGHHILWLYINLTDLFEQCI